MKTDDDVTRSAVEYQPIPESNSEGQNSMVNEGTKKTFKQSLWRFVMLFFACCYLMGSYFCYDNPGPIEKTLEKDLDISTT